MSIQTSFSDFPAVAFAGLLADGDDHRIYPMVNRDSASMPWGAAVAFKPSAATSDQDATLPANSSDIVAGILVMSQAYDRTYSLAGGGTGGELDSTGLVAGAMLNILREGVVWATCEDGCTAGSSRLWVRYDVGHKGVCRASDAGGSSSIDCTKQGQWLTTATAGNLAKLAVNFLAKP